MELDKVEASRLWCRCGLKQASIDSIFDKEDGKSHVCFDDFMYIIKRTAKEDEDALERDRQGASSYDDVQIGDKVELKKGYENKGDAAGGPLQPGERGTVVELQQGPNGQR